MAFTNTEAAMQVLGSGSLPDDIIDSFCSFCLIDSFCLNPKHVYHKSRFFKN